MKNIGIDWQILTKLPGSKDIGPKKFKILDAAHKVVAEEGVQSLGVTSISKRSGLSKSLILYHYNSMDLILADLFFYSAKLARYYIEENLPKAESFEEQIVQVTKALFQWVGNHKAIGEFFVLMFHSAGNTPELSKVQRETLKNGRDIWERIFLESMRYQNLEKLKTDVTGVESLIHGNLLMMVSLQETHCPQKYFKPLKANLESMLNLELPDLDWQVPEVL